MHDSVEIWLKVFLDLGFVLPCPSPCRIRTPLAFHNLVEVLGEAKRAETATFHDMRLKGNPLAFHNLVAVLGEAKPFVTATFHDM